MAIDASIYGNIKPIQVESPVNALAQVTQLKNAQNQNRLFDMQVADSERARADDEAVRAAYQLADPVARSEALRSASPKAYREEQTFQTAQQKAQRDAEKAQYEALGKRLELAGQVFGQVRQNPSLQSANEALDMLQQNGVYDAQTVAKYKQIVASDPSPQTIARLADQALNSSLTSAQQLEQSWKQKNFDLEKDKFGYQKTNDAANRSVTIRGQNMTDSRGRDLAAATREAGGKPPAGYRWATGGVLEPIPGGPAEKDKAPTEFQGKSATFGARAEQSDKIISDLQGKYSPAKIGAKQAAGRVGLEGVANFLLPDEEQKAEQAQRDFVNAVLRQESGAAIADSEFNNAKRQYFPQTGDSAAVIAQKAQNRKTAIEGFKKNAGKAAYTATTDRGDVFSQADAILKGK